MALNEATSGGDVGALPTILILARFLWDPRFATSPVPVSAFSPASNASDHLCFLPWLLQGYWKSTGIQSFAIQKKKKKFSWTFIYIVTVNFPSSICKSFFLFTWKGNTKIWLCTGGGRRLHFSSLSVRFGNFFSPTSESEPSSCCKLCSHPQNGTSQLEWTKVHRWVGEGQGTSTRECLGWGG